MFKKTVSIFLIFILIFSCSVVCPASSSEIDWSLVDRAKIQRTAYLHAGRTDPSASAPSYSNIYSGEDVNIYAAIDKPNKGCKNPDGTYSKDEYQYNLNSYVVKFYFDPLYFDLVYCDTKTHKNPSLTKGANQSAINYMLPFQTMGLTFEDAEQSSIVPWSESEMEGAVADYTDKLSSVTVQNIYGKDYAVVQGIFVIQGENVLFPEQSAVDANWYNLCNITLRPKASASGSTEVMVETGAISNEGAFELIPKHKAGYPYTFKDSTTFLNGGYHQLIIGGAAPVSPPVPDKEPGYYTEGEALTVHLKSATAGAEIFYTLNSSVPKFPNDAVYLPYNDAEGIEILYTQTIRCYARRLINGVYKYSLVMDYNYFIEPPAPTLFFTEGGSSKVPYYYYTDANSFGVYATDKSDRDADISNIYEIYYTFSQTADLDSVAVGGSGVSPETGWARLSKINRRIEITKSTPLRLVTVRGTSAADAEFSSVALYMLYITPAPVEATPGSSQGYTAPFSVELTTVSSRSGAEILFTTNGSDPRTHGILYTEPINIVRNTTIRAVARLGGVFSETTAFNYIFDVLPVLTVSAIPYPGEYREQVFVYLTSGNYDDKIYYTTDGSNPTESSSLYSSLSPIELRRDTEIKAIAFSASGGAKGEVARFRYTIVPDAPVIVPASTQFNENSKKVTVFKPHSGSDYELYYTTDGSDPRVSSSRNQTTADKAEVVITGSSIINAVIKNSSGHYSSVASEAYEIISGRPAKPEVTLEPKIYILSSESGKPYTTSFRAQPEGTKIYYTYAYGTEAETPKKGDAQTYEFSSGDEITLKGNTVIKAIAIDEKGRQSDLGVFYYTIVPEAPRIPESTILPDINDVLLPVSGIEGATVHYNINGVENSVLLSGFNEFYVDPITGRAYLTPEKTTELGSPTPNGAVNSSPFELKAYAELDGVRSSEISGTYTYIASASTVLPPYISIPSGDYSEAAIDENGNGIIESGENTILKPEINCLTKGAEIYYFYADDPSTVYRYSGALNIEKDSIIYMYAQKGEVKSSTSLAFYRFIPLPPVIKPVSGIYNGKIEVMISENPLSPKAANRVIYYRKATETAAGDTPYLGGRISVESDEIIKAYTIKDYNPLEAESGVRSDAVYEYYLFSGGSVPGSGKVYVNSPFDMRHTFAVNELLESPCNQGITLGTVSGYNIRYKYEVELRSGETYSIPEAAFIMGSSAPIYPSPLWNRLKITAWLVDDEENIISGSLADFNYNFVVLNKPVSSLAETDASGNPILYDVGTNYRLINEYDGSGRSIKLYYTTDGSDPKSSPSVKEFNTGNVLTLNSATTLRAIYQETVDGISFFGPEAKFIYAIKSGGGGSSGGGGGGGGRRTVDNTRKYTKDIFGNEHPTHIGYIKGYPDGSVKPNGQITREEMAAILYRITNHEYEKPFAETGSVFPDVAYERWSVREIEYMADKGVIEGYPSGEFKPSGNLTRAEFAALICRFAKLDETKQENPFPDLDSEHWAFDYVLRLYASGLLSGYEDKTFRAENEITRAEVMTVVNKILGRKPIDEYVKSLDYNPFTDLYKTDWHYVIVLEATITHNYYLDYNGFEYRWEDCK